jgi:hypothetical protein
VSNDIIRALYEARLFAFADARELPVQFENQRFDPPANENPEENIYMQGFLLPARTVSNDLSGDHRGYRGIFQISIVMPKGIGTGLAKPIKVGLHDLFSMNLILTDGSGFKVQIVRPLSEGPGITGETLHAIPLSFEYRSEMY